MPDDVDPSAEFRDVARGAVASVLFGGGEWRIVDLREWQKDRRGRWRCQLEWFAAGTTWSGWFLYEPEKMRET